MNAASSSRDHWVAGVDGCRAGWVVVLRELTTGTLRARATRAFADVLTLVERPRVIAVDIPIGLLPAGAYGGRECDRLARRALGQRRSSVFSPPSRLALDAYQRHGRDAYWMVSAANSPAASGPRLSRQAFAILPEIDEVDAVITRTRQRFIREIHPELCFAEANRGRPMRNNKKSSAGRRERLALLRRLGYLGPLSLLEPTTGVQPDDVIDACIASWTATRIARGIAVALPVEPERDARGLRMEIWR